MRLLSDVAGMEVIIVCTLARPDDQFLRLVFAARAARELGAEAATQRNVAWPFVIGPDIESEQWVSEVASRAGAPYVVLQKDRHGDRSVEIAIPDLEAWRDRQPVLIDEIVSSGRTMIEASEGLIARGLKKPVCLAVHALFAEDAFKRLSELAQRVVSTDCVPHSTNLTAVAPLIAAALGRNA